MSDDGVSIAELSEKQITYHSNNLWNIDLLTHE
jgi:hypothetical protein